MRAVVLCLVLLCVEVFATPNNPNVAIIEASQAVKNQFPYLVSVRHCLGTNCEHVCGGAIFDLQWVLTVAHCVSNATTSDRYEIVAGILNVNDSNSERQVVEVQSVIIHPEYKSGINLYDVAILKLQIPLNFTREVYPLDLLEENLNILTDVIIAGWGTSGKDDIMPNTVHFARVPIIPPKECRTTLDTLLGNQSYPFDEKANLCTGPLTEEVFICVIDSGGPIVDLKVTRIVGILSWAVLPCGTVGAPLIHNRVNYYTRWIKESIAKE